MRRNTMILRVSVPLFIYVISILALKSGVQLKNEPLLGEEPVGILFFHITSFFTFGAKDYGPPIAGPLFWQYIIYFVYYAAPINFLSAVAEMVYVLSKPLLPLMLYGKRYFLVIGYGIVGKAAAEFLHKEYPKSRIFILKNDAKADTTGMGLFKWRTIVQNRDMRDPKSLYGLPLKHTSAIFILTDDEWLNIKLYYDIKNKLEAEGVGEGVRILVRISSVDILGYMEGRYEKVPHVHFFNVHTVACGELFDFQYINNDIQTEFHQFDQWRKQGLESVVFFAFGRFSTAFLRHIINDQEIKKTLKNITIIDPRAVEAWEYFISGIEDTIPFEVSPIKGTMEDYILYKEHLDRLDKSRTLVVFGSNDEFKNFRYAAGFRDFYGRNSTIKFILRARTELNMPEEVIKRFLGDHFILISTHVWVKDFFEDVFRKSM